MNSSNNIVAGAAIASPIWLPYLQHFSEIAALFLPIVGCVWLIIQIVGYVTKPKKENINERT